MISLKNKAFRLTMATRLLATRVAIAKIAAFGFFILGVTATILVVVVASRNFAVAAEATPNITDPNPKTITVAAVGDLMLGTENLLPPDGGAGFLREAAPYFKGRDIVFGNLEGPLTDRGQPTKVVATGRSYCFRTPPSYGRFFQEAGFNILSLANNHSNDYGPLGRAQTEEVLAALNIKTVGAPSQLTVLDLGQGRQAVFLALAPNLGCQNINDLEGAVALVKKAQKDYPGALVVVSFHGGAEGSGAMDLPLGPEVYLGEKRGDLRRLATTLIDNGASLILGHGPHVPRGLEVYRERLIAYSLGNFATAAGINVKGATGLAPLLLAELALDGRLIKYEIISFRQVMNQGPRLDRTEEAKKVIADLSEKVRQKINESKTLRPAKK
ncbi:MAG: CapA family protein [Deltaproteobacteria bacterium]|jgi:poly-gamma-glutamate capsule biosynthesis protein CapA/YwtB (metallophosphatase superfamily)|nr:CapA family protein [Deltaproteobacteria bacterium]